MVQVRLLGRLQLVVGGRPAEPPPTRRARALLAWLALHPGARPRSQAAGALWPDQPEQAARTNLRGAVAELRRSLGDEHATLLTSREHVGLSPSVEVDRWLFDEAVRAAQWDRALDLDGGPLLPDMGDDWLEVARQEHHHERLLVLERSAGVAEAGGRLADALALARRRADLDPLSEVAGREVVRLLAALGDGAAALAAARALARRLREELGVPPSPDTVALVRGLRLAGPGPTTGTAVPRPAGPSRRIGPTDRPAPAGPDGPGGPEHLDAPPPGALRRHRDEHGQGVVGREDAVTTVVTAVEASASSGSGVVVVSGEAGIGKTTVALEACARSDALVLVGRCDEDGVVPYGPVVEALDDLLRALPDAQRTRLLTGAGPELSRLLPSLQGDGGRPQRPDGEADTERWRLFEAVTGLLQRAAAQRTVVLVVDDAHWADRAGVLLLRHVVRSLPAAPLTVLLTVRDPEVAPHETLAAWSAALRREDRVREVALSGLSREDVAELVRRRRSSVDPDLVRTLHAETEGNPYFVSEMLRAQPSEPGTLPPRVRDVVARRLAPLPDGTRDVLAAASVVTLVARDAEVRVLARVLDRPPAAVLGALEQAERAALVTETGVGRFGFTHALTRTAVYGDLGRSRRALLHGAVADVLREETGPDAAVAHHLLASDDPARRHEAVAAATAAARAAVAAAAYEDAARLLGRALEVVGADGDERLPLLLALGDAHGHAGDLPSSRRSYAEASLLARRGGDLLSVCRAALGVAGPSWRRFGAVDAEAVEHLRGALRALDAFEGRGAQGLDGLDGLDGQLDGLDAAGLRTLLQARLAVALYWADRHDEVWDLADAALVTARRRGVPEELAVALEAALWAAWGPDGVERRLGLADELVSVADAAGDAELAVQALRWRVVALLEAGRAGEVRRAVAAHAAAARDRRLPYELMYVAVFQAMTAMLEARVQDARTASVHVAAFADLRGGDDAVQFGGVHAVLLALLEGDGAALVDEAGRFAAAYPSVSAWRAAHAFLLVAAGRADEATQVADGLWPPDRVLPRDAVWLTSCAFLALVVHLTGDRPRAAHLRQVLAPYAGRPVVVGAGGAVLGTVDLYLALLALTDGDLPAASARLADAASVLGRLGGGPWLARMLQVLGLGDQAGAVPVPARG